MNLRSRSTPNASASARASARATPAIPAIPATQAKSRAPKSKTATSASASASAAKRKVSQTDFESSTGADENSDASAAAPTTTRSSQRRRLITPTEVEIEVVVPTPSKSTLKSQPSAATPSTPLAAQPTNASDVRNVVESAKDSAPDPPKPAGECITIVARDTESALIQTFLTHRLGPPPSASTTLTAPTLKPIVSSALYICGSPGVGKTALVTQLVSAYPPAHATAIHVNCFSLRPPEAVYAKIVRLLGMALGVADERLPAGSKKREAVGVKHIEAMIRAHVIEANAGADAENAALPSTPVKKHAGRKAGGVKKEQAGRKQAPVLLILDELDALYPPSTSSISTDFPAVLYSLFSLTHTLSPHLSLIGIANALDLTARLLPHLTGALAPLTLTFHSYSVPSLVKVLQSHFGTLKLKPAAAVFIARAVAKDSSDVRKALAIARDAVARARRAGKDGVDVKEVHEAIKGMAANAPASAGAGVGGAAGVSGVAARVRAKPAHAKMALAALMSMVAPTAAASNGDAAYCRPFAGQVDNGSYVAASSLAADGTHTTKSSAGPPTCMQLYNAYCALVAKFPSVPLKPVHEAEFVDLVAVLEHDRLVRVMRTPGASTAGGAAGARSKRSTGLVKDEVKSLRSAKVVLVADVDEVRRGLTTAGVGVAEEEVAGRADLVGEYLREVLGVDAE